MHHWTLQHRHAQGIAPFRFLGNAAYCGGTLHVPPDRWHRQCRFGGGRSTPRCPCELRLAVSQQPVARKILSGTERRLRAARDIRHNGNPGWGTVQAHRSATNAGADLGVQCCSRRSHGRCAVACLPLSVQQGGYAPRGAARRRKAPATEAPQGSSASVMPKYATAKRRTRRAIGIGRARAGSNVIDKMPLEAY